MEGLILYKPAMLTALHGRAVLVLSLPLVNLVIQEDATCSALLIAPTTLPGITLFIDLCLIHAEHWSSPQQLQSPTIRL